MIVLMTGPGKGHNVQRFLRWFNKRPQEYRLHYHRYNKAEHYPLESFAEVGHLSTFDIVGLARAARKADIIWVHNWTPWPFLMVILAVKRRKTVLNFNFWSEKLPRQILVSDNKKSRFYRYFFSKCDVLQTSWYSVKDLVDDLGHSNVRLMRWGFEEEYFEPVREEELSEFAVNFVEGLPRQCFKFFVPKTIGFPNRHDVMVVAAAELVSRGVTDFCVYFWKGNRVEIAMEEKIIAMITDLEVSEQVKLVDHPFLSNHDMAYIWHHMDAGLQICDQDQLSTAFTEPQLFEKRLLASRIPSYQRFNAEFGLDIPLVPNEPKHLAERMLELMKGKTDSGELAKRSGVIKKHFHFEENMKDIIQYLQGLR